MKQRVISAIVALIICIPLLLIGGGLYDLGIIILSLLFVWYRDSEYSRIIETLNITISSMGFHNITNNV